MTIIVSDEFNLSLWFLSFVREQEINNLMFEALVGYYSLSGKWVKV